MSNNIDLSVVRNLTLITGGARSGKSAFAELLAERTEGPVYYIATMEEMQSDPETVERIKRHRDRRPEHWVTIESSCEAEKQILKLANAAGACIFDCLSLYISNHLMKHYEHCTAERCEEELYVAAYKLLDAIQAKPEIRFFVVTNEVGWGIVPDNKLARLYRDLLGLTNQSFARVACEVWLSCSGVQMRMKP